MRYLLQSSQMRSKCSRSVTICSASLNPVWTKNQRDYILREQLKVIREELGEESTSDIAEEYRQKVSELQASQRSQDKLNKEIDRFKSDEQQCSRKQCAEHLYRDTSCASVGQKV